MDRKCSKCDRRSCMPEPYEPECAKHHIESIKRAQKQAEARFKKHIEELYAAHPHRVR